jgi:hypothetical protein
MTVRVDGARIPPDSVGSAPCRSRSMSSMLSAPPTIPATRHVSNYHRPSSEGIFRVDAPASNAIHSIDPG